ncbi:hypothetical protein [Endothiovibrio diazotrophicus]
MSATHLEDLIPPGEPELTLIEILLLVERIGAGDKELIRRAFHDTIRLFHGEYPGYRASNTRYHDLDHTCAVVLAMARLLHGAHCEGVRWSDRGVALGLLGALFHDVGLIQKSDDLEGTGAKYTLGHEHRSVEFLGSYLAEVGIGQDAIEEAGQLIGCTIMSRSPQEFRFGNDELRLLGFMVGTADLLAQMAERTYLEKLLLLFREFEEAEIPGFDSELILLEKTEAFYTGVVKRRLEEQLGGVYRHMVPHFRERWGIQEDLYQRMIRQNLAYLHQVLEEDKALYRERLRRGGIVQQV